MLKPGSESYKFRVALFKAIPPLTLVLGLAAFVISHAVDSTSSLLNHEASSAYWEVFWSVILTIDVIAYFKRRGSLTRTVAWVAGIIGYVALITTNVIPMYSAALNGSNSPIAIHDLVAFCLISMAWVLGTWWSFQALAFSISSGDWKKTIWASQRRNDSER